jgi:membrane dipeptidase
LTAHNWANNFAEFVLLGSKIPRLNERGKAVVREMNRLGMGDQCVACLGRDDRADRRVERGAGTRDTSWTPAWSTTFRATCRGSDAESRGEGGVIGFQIGNEFHNVKAFNWRTQHAGKPFWDTAEIAARKEQMTIEEIDKRVAPQFPMVGPEHAG